MSQVFSLTEQYAKQLMSREDSARLSMLKDYRGVWTGLEKNIDSAVKRIEFSAAETLELAEAFSGDLAESSDLPTDKLDKFTDLLMKKNSWQELERGLQQDFLDVAANAAATTERHRGALGQTAVDHAVKLMQAQLGGKKAAPSLSKKALAALNEQVKNSIDQMWRDRRDSIEDLFRAKAAEAADRARAALRQEVLHGILTGANGEKILGRVKQAIEERGNDPERDPTLVRALRAEYRVATQNTYREALRFTAAESGRVSSWRWTSSRKSTTCALCWAMDGKIFPIDTPLKSHPHCRCVPVPVVEDEAGNALREMQGDEREGGETGETAFTDIPRQQQKAILGMKAFAAYERGEFDLSDLIGVQFNDRFGVTLYRQSVDNAIDKKNPNIQAALEMVGGGEFDPFGIAQSRDIDPNNFIAANIGGYQRRAGEQIRATQGADTYDDSLGYSGLTFAPGDLDGKKKKPKLKVYTSKIVSIPIYSTDSQLDRARRALYSHAELALLNSADAEAFVTHWTSGLDDKKFALLDPQDRPIKSDKFEQDKLLDKKEKVTRGRVEIGEKILQDLQERQKKAYDEGRLRNQKAKPAEGDEAESDGGQKGTAKIAGSKSGSGRENSGEKAGASSTLPSAGDSTLTNEDADELLNSLPPIIGSGDGTITIQVANLGTKSLTDFYILGYFIQQNFGGQMWGQDVNDYTAIAYQNGVEMTVLQRDDESDPRVYRIQFSASSMQKLAKVRLQWQQEYANRVLSNAKSKEEVNNLFLDFLKVYPNLGIEYLEQLLNTPIDKLNELGDPVSMIPGSKEAKLILGLLGYETPDFKLFEYTRFSLDDWKFQYGSEMWKRDGEKIEQGTIFAINLLLLKRSLGGPKGPIQLNIKGGPKGPAAAPLVKDKPDITKSDADAPNLTNPANVQKSSSPTRNTPVLKPNPTVAKQKTIQTPSKPQPQKQPAQKQPVQKQVEKVAEQKPARIEPIGKDQGYKGKWPPARQKGKQPDIQTPEGADWRYQRYIHKKYLEGKKPTDIYSREKWDRTSLEPARAGKRPGRAGDPDQQATRQMLAEKEDYINSENIQLGKRYNSKTKKDEKNFVDMYKEIGKNRLEYIEVDSIGVRGLPTSRMRAKLKEEILALRKGEKLTIIDKKDPSRRIEYKYGDPPLVVDSRRAPK